MRTDRWLLGTMPLRIPLGTSDFAQLRRASDTYVDKTGLAVELIRTSSRVVLLPRPLCSS